MSVIVSNRIVLNSKQARKETLDGREFRAVPLILMRDGVQTANAGSLYYTPEVNSDRPNRWNQRPLVVYHPEVNGELVSALSPGILDKRGIGYVFNAGYSKPSVAGEAWFDVEKTNKVDGRIIKAVDAGETLEVSAGYELSYREEAGEVDGEKYTGVVVNTNPDHVAILPDKKGACDVKKGCGAGVNVGNCAHEELHPLVANEASYSRIESALQQALYKVTDYSGYVRDVYSDFFIYQNNGSLYKRGYSTDKDGKVTIADGEATQVKWVMEYRDLSGKFVGNTQKGPETKEPTVADTSKELVKQIIACNVGYEEADLEGMKEPALKKLLEKTKTSVVANKETPKEEPKEEKPAAKATPGTITIQEWLVANNAPEVLHEVVEDAIEYKNTLVGNIMKMKGNKFTEATLRRMKSSELQNVVEMLTPTQEAAPARRPIYGEQPVVTVGNTAAGQKKQQPLAPSNNIFAAKK
jgi:hypothetical protein